MRHAKARLQLNRFTSWRKATVTGLARSLVLHQRIQTTRARALASRALIEKLIRLARENSLSARRQAYRLLGDHGLIQTLFNDIGPRFKLRNSGFTRIINLKQRRGDNAELVILELTEIKKEGKKKVKKEKEEISQAKKVEPSSQSQEEEKKTTAEALPKEPYQPVIHKPAKKFLGGLRKIFKKERDSL